MDSKVRWWDFAYYVLRQGTKKKLYETIKKAADVRKEVTGVLKADKTTFSGATASELVRAVEKAGEVSERVRTLLYEAYPQEIVTVSEVRPPRLRELRANVNLENAKVKGSGEEEEETKATFSEKEGGYTSERKGGDVSEGGGGTKVKLELESKSEISQKNELALYSERIAGELQIWERWLTSEVAKQPRGAQIETHLYFRISDSESTNTAWERTVALPFYSERVVEPSLLRLTVTVLTCSDGKCTVELPEEHYAHLARSQRRLTFLWTRAGRWELAVMETSHATEVFGRQPDATLSHLYAPPEMIAGLMRRFLEPENRGMTVMLYRPWAQQNEYLGGTWVRGEIRTQSRSHIRIRVDRQDVSFQLPVRGEPQDHIPLLETTTTLRQKIGSSTVYVIYILSLVPRFSEQIEMITKSTVDLLPTSLVRLIGDFIL
jgi:hypothetical protein